MTHRDSLAPKLKDRPEGCSPEQIRQCHGEDAGHPCTGGGE
jgi:hypothetical protein